MARLIAYIPQQPDVNLAVPVIDAVKIGRSPYIGYKLSKRDEDLVFEVIERLGLQGTRLPTATGVKRRRTATGCCLRE